MRALTPILLALLATPAFAARERTGNVDVFIVLDESGSMKPIFQKVTEFVADALVTDYMEPGDYLCIVGFSNAPRVRVSQRLSSPAEKANLAEIVRRLNVVPQGFTDMGRSLEETIRQLDSLAHASHQQILLILTDGVNQPPRDSLYYSPLRSDLSGGTPPSSFNALFLEQVRALSAEGHRMHVVGIGTDTDAKKLGEALGAGYTLLKEFNLEELRNGLSRFWDDTINLVGLDSPEGFFLPGKARTLRVRLFSTSEQDREIELAGATVTGVEPQPQVALTARRVAAPPKRETTFEVTLTLPPDAGPGDYRGSITFEQTSAVKFYPPEAEFSFHVPSFWERHGGSVLASTSGLLFVGIGVIFYRRRPIPVVMIVDGQQDSGKPVPFRIAALCSFGGGATDRFRLPGLPQKVAVLERRTVDRFAFISTKPDLVPTLPQYTLGEPIEVRTGEGPDQRRIIRFDRSKKKSARPRSRPALAPRSTSGAVDFR